MLRTRKDLANYVAYVGTGSPRFYLPLDGLWPAGARAVEVRFDVPLGAAPRVVACPG